jgi:hypothetical protein
VSSHQCTLGTSLYLSTTTCLLGWWPQSLIEIEAQHVVEAVRMLVNGRCRGHSGSQSGETQPCRNIGTHQTYSSWIVVYFIALFGRVHDQVEYALVHDTEVGNSRRHGMILDDSPYLNKFITTTYTRADHFCYSTECRQCGLLFRVPWCPIGLVMVNTLDRDLACFGGFSGWTE